MTAEERVKIQQEVEAGVCEFMHIHEEIVDKVEKVMPDEQQLLNLSEFFNVILPLCCKWGSQQFLTSYEF